MKEEIDEPDRWWEDAVIEIKDDEKPATDNENGNIINIKDKCNDTYWTDTGNPDYKSRKTIFITFKF